MSRVLKLRVPRFSVRPHSHSHSNVHISKINTRELLKEAFFEGMASPMKISLNGNICSQAKELTFSPEATREKLKRRGKAS